MIKSLRFKLRASVLTLIFTAAAGLLHAAEDAKPGNDSAPSAKDDTTQYLLSPHDQIKVSVQGQSDCDVERRIDGQGQINVPLLGPVKVGGLTVGEAQDLIVKKYVDAEIFVHPQVVVAISEYVPRAVVVMGQVDKTGKVDFPPEATSMSIVDAIAAAGGYTRLGNPHSVSVTRKDDQGVEQTTTLDVQKMIDGHVTKDEMFQVQPGDIIYVPERLF